MFRTRRNSTRAERMAIEKEQPKQKLDRSAIAVDRRKYPPKQKAPTQQAADPTPLGTWLQETSSEQPWNALASVGFDSSWAECTAQSGEQSLMAEYGSVEDGK